MKTFVTARKTIFFFQIFLKDVLSKKLHWIMILLVLSRKMIFLSPENIILFFIRKRKDDLSQKVIGNTMFSSNILKRWFFQIIRTWTWSFFVISGKIVLLFSIKYDIFSLKTENERSWSLFPVNFWPHLKRWYWS